MSTYVRVVSINMWENLISELTQSWKLIVDHHLITECAPRQQCAPPATRALAYGGSYSYTPRYTYAHTLACFLRQRRRNLPTL